MDQIDAVRRVAEATLMAGSAAADSKLPASKGHQLAATRAVEAMVRDIGNAAADQQTGRNRA